MSKTNEESCKKITIQEFRDTGLLWYINTQLHLFGFALAHEVENDILVPMKTKFRGFAEENNTEGYRKVTKYMKDNAKKLLKACESEEKI